MFTSSQKPQVPVYIRLPRYGASCPYTGLSRSALDLLTRPQPKNEFRPPVKSKIFRADGRGKGIRLVEYASLMVFLSRLPSSQTEEVAAEEPKVFLESCDPDEFLAYQPPYQNVLVGDCHIVRGSVFVIAGPAGVGKSRATLALALAGATGELVWASG